MGARPVLVDPLSSVSWLVILIVGGALLLTLFLTARGQWQRALGVGGALVILLIFVSWLKTSLDLREVTNHDHTAQLKPRTVKDETASGAPVLRQRVRRAQASTAAEEAPGEKVDDDTRREPGVGTTQVSQTRLPSPTGSDGPPPETPPGAQRIVLADDFATWTAALPLGFRALNSDSSSSTPTWADDGDGSRRLHTSLPDALFVYWEPGPTGSLVGYSSVSASREEALNDALETVRKKVGTLALLRLKYNDPSLDIEAALPLAIELSRTESRFNAGDEHVQVADRDYGPIFRAAVRVEAPDEAIGDLAIHVRKEVERGWIAQQQKLGEVLWTGASVLALAFAIFLLYTFMNAGTKGHFAVPLRILSAAMFFLLCAVVFYVRAQLSSVSGSAARQASAHEISRSDPTMVAPEASPRNNQADPSDGRRTGSGQWGPLPHRRDPQGLVDRVPAARRPVRRTAESIRQPTAVR